MAYSQINLDSPVAVQGMKATPDQSVYTPRNFLVADAAGIAVGGFVDYGSTDGTVTAAITNTTPLGFVERVINSFNYDLTSTGTLVVPQGGTLTIAVKGDYYVAAPETVAIGGPVYCNDTTGAVTTSSDSDKVDTKWVYKTAGAKDEMVIISNWA